MSTNTPTHKDGSVSRDIRSFAQALNASVSNRMYGVDSIVRLCLTALFSDGHVLLEGNPGLGKTELVKSLAGALRLPFGRIQFTPDLMPADITGTFMPDFEQGDSRRLAFRPGPIFTSLLLADEINRATPKTQAAMLEAMAERQVTVLGSQRKLEAPFMVLATQNPIDHEGTFALPEAQSDRFMFKVTMPTPNVDTLRLILAKDAGMTAEIANPPAKQDLAALLPKDPADSRRKYEAVKGRVLEMPPLPSLETHVLNLFQATNGHFDRLVGLEKSQLQTLAKLTPLLAYGLGPRAATALVKGAKAYALLFAEDTDHAHAPALAAVALPALRHRVKMAFDWEYSYRELHKKQDIENLHDHFLATYLEACAPKAYEYARLFQECLKGN
jgi:MoxR-like ATPase